MNTSTDITTDTTEMTHIDDPEAGMATAEYAVGTVAASSLAGLLVWLFDQDWVRSMLSDLFRGIFTIIG